MVVTPSKAMREALLDMADGRVLERTLDGWGADLMPGEINGKRCRVFLGNVKTGTFQAMLRRGWIELREKLTYDKISRGVPSTYRITEAGMQAALGKSARNDVQV